MPTDSPVPPEPPQGNYCYGCAPLQFGGPPERNHLADPLCPEGAVFFAECDGCGPGFFDRSGKRIYDAVRDGDEWTPVQARPRLQLVRRRPAEEHQK